MNPDLDAPPVYTASDENASESGVPTQRTTQNPIIRTQPQPVSGWKETFQGIRNTFSVLSHWSIAKNEEYTTSVEEPSKLEEPSSNSNHAFPLNQMPVTSRNVGDKVFARHTKSGKYLPGTIIEPTKGVKIDKESFHVVYFQTFKKVVTKDIKDFDEKEINSFITVGNNLLALQQAMDDDFPLEHAIEHPDMYKGEPKKRKSKTKNANNKKSKTSKDINEGKSEIEEITLIVDDEELKLSSTPKKANKTTKTDKSTVKKTSAEETKKTPAKETKKTPKKTPSKKVIDSVIESDKVVLDDEKLGEKQVEKTPTRASTPKSVKQTVADISQSLNITPSPSKLSLASEQSYDDSVFSDASTNLSTIFVNSKPKQWVDVLDYIGLWN